MNNAHWLVSREIVERIIIEGNIVLETPTGLGTGDDDSLVDIPLALDPLENRALLTGASLAGALRNYLREREHGYRQKGGRGSLDSFLFGMQDDKEGEQSLLIINDSLSNYSDGTKRHKIETRDGVKINPRTRTTIEKKKFDFELIEAGTIFPVKIELLVRDDIRDNLMRGLGIALLGLENGEIRLGVRKNRGFGQCIVKEWSVRRYDLTKPHGLVDWIANDLKGIMKGENIVNLLGLNEGGLVDNRKYFNLNAKFSLEGTINIRSSFDRADAPDSVHLHSKRKGKSVPIISGTSLAGALRARALRISRSINNSEKAIDMVEGLFGKDIESSDDQAFASRIVTAETEIIDPLDLIQSRVKIDRFTGGSFPTALFDAQPVFGKKCTLVKIKLVIYDPSDAQIGLLLLLLKDMWTGDISLGGEASVGRGRLRGMEAEMVYRQVKNDEMEKWKIKKIPLETKGDKSRLEIEGDKLRLENFVETFWKEIQ